MGEESRPASWREKPALGACGSHDTGSASIATKQYKEVDSKKIDVDVQDLDMHVVGTMMLHVGRE